MIADLPGARIWFEDSGGKGAPVVFLHAGSGSCALWARQAEAFAKAGFRFVAYDRRGHGKSESLDGAPPTASEDLHALADALGLGAFHLVGTAAGGIVALDFALSFPQRLRSLVVANSVGGVQDESYVALMKRLRPPAFEALPAELRELGPCYRAADPDGTRQWCELEHASRAPGTPTLPRTKNRITFDALGSLGVQTLLLTGDADLYVPPPVLALFAARIPRSQSIVIPACGHSAYWEQPHLFNQAVLDFINRCQTPI